MRGTVRRGLVRAAVAPLGLALAAFLAGCSASAEAESAPATEIAVDWANAAGVDPFVVSARDLGIHSNHTRPSVPTGAIRLNCYPTWREINPAKGVYEWARMDELVDRARSWGYEDVVHSFCGTPEWAGGAVKEPDREVFGYRSTAAPNDMADWESYVTAVVKRYKGRITAYQAWNEGTTTQFFQGTPAQLAEMTEELNAIVATHDPQALVVSASVQQVNQDQRNWGQQYLRELKNRDWPVEVLSSHGYGPNDSLTDGRQEAIANFRRQLAAVAAPALPVWDTETTYTGQEVTGEKAGALVIRSYLDAWRMGVQRTYWYIWFEGFNSFGSIQMRSGGAPAAALERLGAQVIGATFNGCAEAPDGLVRCSFSRSDQDLTIMWAEDEVVTVSPGVEAQYQNMVTGDVLRDTSITVGGTPLLVNAGL